MQGRRTFAVLVGCVSIAFATSAGGTSVPTQDSAATKDYARTALNVLPAGQYGSVPPPPEATQQSDLYDGLTPLFGDVTNDDLTKYFKSEALGTDGQGPLHNESKTPPGVKIVRDKFNVPHIYAKTVDALTVGTGWVAAEDRGLLLEQARYNSRVAAIDAPGLSALDLIVNLKRFEPSPQTEDEIAKQTDVLLAAGAKGRAVLHDIDKFVEGINAYYKATDNPAKPWARNDVYALDALKGQFVGQGGGDEALRSQLLNTLQAKLGDDQGLAVFNDLREVNDPETPTSVPGSVSFGPAPRSRKGNVILDEGSFEPAPIPPAATTQSGPTSTTAAHASNALLVAGSRSTNHHPLMIAGPQIGYYYPGLLMEVDLHGPGIAARGSTSAPFPGYVLIGRAQDYAWSLTSASLDIIDTYAETLCNGSDTKYQYKGKCRDMTPFDAGTLDGEPMAFYRTVHGPVFGYATVDGRKVALVNKRSSYGKDVLDLLLFRDLTRGSVHNVHEFFHAVNQTPQTINSFYLDDRDIGVFTSGLVPVRAPDVDPGLPTDGTGDHEWRGFVPFDEHPSGVNPPNGQIVNWNNRTIAGYPAADDDWSLGAEQRVQLLTDNLGTKGGQTLASLTAAMNKAATQDVRAMLFEPLLAEVLRGGAAPSPLAGQMLDLLDAWHSAGGSRLDRDLDGKIDDPGAAIIDAAWPKLADAWASSVLGELSQQLAEFQSRFNAPPGGQFSGWHIYMDKDLRTLLGRPVKGKFAVRYCGGGDLAACRDALWNAMKAAGDELAASQGPDPAAWRAAATAERIKFAPGLLTQTMRYTNRPSGIQQVITFDGHRP